MKSLLALCSIVAVFAPSIAGEVSKPKPEEFVGTWRVDLRPTPDAEAYFQELVVRTVNGNTFEGTFYGSEIKHARLNADWGILFFAFVTNDGSGDYNTSGSMDAGILRGTTHSLGREFLSVWSAHPAE